MNALPDYFRSENIVTWRRVWSLTSSSWPQHLQKKFCLILIWLHYLLYIKPINHRVKVSSEFLLKVLAETRLFLRVFLRNPLGSITSCILKFHSSRQKDTFSNTGRWKERRKWSGRSSWNKLYINSVKRLYHRQI